MQRRSPDGRNKGRNSARSVSPAHNQGISLFFAPHPLSPPPKRRAYGAGLPQSRAEVEAIGNFLAARNTSDFRSGGWWNISHGRGVGGAGASIGQAADRLTMGAHNRDRRQDPRGSLYRIPGKGASLAEIVPRWAVQMALAVRNRGRTSTPLVSFYRIPDRGARPAVGRRSVLLRCLKVLSAFRNRDRTHERWRSPFHIRGIPGSTGLDRSLKQPPKPDASTISVWSVYQSSWIFIKLRSVKRFGR